MNEKRLLLILSSFLFISMFSFAGYAEPTWSNITNVTPSNYSPTNYSEFAVNWTDDVNMAFITIINSTDGNGTVLVNNSSMTNTYGGDIYNFSIVLPAGTWNWTSYANNSSNEWNSTNAVTVEIGKGIVPLLLENSDNWSATYLVETNTTGSGCPNQLNCTLYRNDTYIGDSNPVSDVNDSFDIGSYVYIYNTSGNENYSSNSTTNTLIVNKIPTSISLWIDSVEASKSFNLNDIANFTAMINVTNLTINLTTNYTGWNDTYNDTVFYNTTNLTEEGLFYITASYDGNETHAPSSTTYYFDTIPPEISFLTANTSEYDFNKTYWFNITVFSANISSVTLEFNNTSQSVSNSSNMFFWSIRDLTAGGYTYRWNVTNSLGNETTTGNISFNVTKKTPSVLFYFSHGYTVLSGITTTVNCSILNGESIINLYRNGGSSGVSQPSGSVYAYDTHALADGDWNYTCFMIESDNYTYYSESHIMTLESGTFNPGGGSDGTDDTTTPAGEFTLSTSDSSLTIDAGSSRVISFTIANSLSSGDVTDVTVTVIGISSEWYALDKTTVDRVRKGDSEVVRMTLNIPTNASADTYTITFKIVGTSFSGSTLPRETTVQLTVSNDQEVVIEETPLVIDQNTTNNTVSNATGFLNISSEYVPYMVILLAATLSILIFFKRDALTQNLMKIGGVTPTKESKKPKKSIKLPSLKNFSYKLSINLSKEKKGDGPRTLDLKEDKAEGLEREIKKDMKELENILETEKRLKKHRK
jgi:methionine-rich copper-binding protein CopC